MELSEFSGRGPVAGSIVDALKRLEYRGYDSAGVATLESGRAERRRAEGKLHNLEAKPAAASRLAERSASATRAGRRTAAPTETQRPSARDRLRLAVVHNGIIENFRALRQELATPRVTCSRRETDTEVVAFI